MGIPRFIEIGPFIYVVQILDIPDEDSKSLLGQISYTECSILIDKRQSSQVKPVTLLHEVLHGILANAGYLDHPEGMLDALSIGLIDVIRKNTQLVDYLKEIDGPYITS